MKFKITQIVIVLCLLFVTGITTSCSNDDPNNTSTNLSGTWIMKLNEGENPEVLFQFENGGIKFLGNHSELNENVTLNTYTLKNNQLNVFHNREFNYPNCPNDEVVNVKEKMKIDAIYDSSINKFKGSLSTDVKGGNSGNCTVQDFNHKYDNVTIEKKQ